MTTPPIRQVMGALTQVTERSVRVVTIEIAAELTEATPVDLGWARANHVASLTDPAIDTTNPSTRDERRQNLASAQAKQQAGIASIAGYTLNGGRVFINNNVPYLGRLNAGSSTQAPAGFIENAIDTGFKSATQKLGRRTS